MSSPQLKLIEILNSAGRPYQMAHHDPCRTSAESAAARAAAGLPKATGAKALIIRLSKGKMFNLIVLAGPDRLDGKVARRRVGDFRFATAEEVALATGGLEPGMVPPFGPPVLANIDKVYVDARLKDHPVLGFNAACLTASIVIACSDYLSICGAEVVENFSVAS